MLGFYTSKAVRQQSSDLNVLREPAVEIYRPLDLTKAVFVVDNFAFQNKTGKIWPNDPGDN